MSKHRRSALIGAAVLLALVSANKIFALDPHLAPLAPLLNKEWRGTMKSVDGSPDWEVVCRFESVWTGKAVKYYRSAPAQKNEEEETFLYWDDIAGKIAFFSIHSGGTFRTGYVTAEGDTLTFEGRMTWPSPPPDPRVNQAYDFRNTFTFTSGEEMIDRWFQNAFGPWRPGHEIVFKAAAKSAGIPADSLFPAARDGVCFRRGDAGS